MNKQQQKKNQRLILLIFALTFIPFLIAWYLRENPEWLAVKTHSNGTLITPLIVTELSEFSGFDQFSRDNMTELKGHWVLLQVIPTSECGALCVKTLQDTKQLLLMMGKDLVRIRRLALLLKSADAQSADRWWKDDSRLLRARASASLLQKIQAIPALLMTDGLLLLMDPLGNLMMYYAPGFDPYKVKADLKKLLSVSQIG